MSKELLLSSFLEGKPYHQLSEYIKGKTSCFAENLVGSSLSFVLFDIFKRTGQTLLFVGDDKEQAAYLLNDLELLLGQEQVLFFPSTLPPPLSDRGNGQCQCAPKSRSTLPTPTRGKGGGFL